ncbi:MAG: prepilin peptidase [Clostridium sp.]
MKLTYTLYLLIASWQDLKNRKIAVWLYVVFAITGVLENILWQEFTWGEVVAAMIPGGLLLLLTKCSRGAIGSGDGWFFVVSAVYLGFWNITALLLYGLMCCSICCLGIIVWGSAAGIPVRKMRLPFLPFLFPVWIWIGKVWI